MESEDNTSRPGWLSINNRAVRREFRKISAKKFTVFIYLLFLVKVRCVLLLGGATSARKRWLDARGRGARRATVAAAEW